MTLDQLPVPLPHERVQVWAGTSGGSTAKRYHANPTCHHIRNIRRNGERLLRQTNVFNCRLRGLTPCLCCFGIGTCVFRENGWGRAQ